MRLESRFSISQDILAQQLGEEIVILDPKSGTYFGLDAVGSRIWRLAEEGKCLGDICEALVDEYEICREDIERDAARLAEELIAHRLISIE